MKKALHLAISILLAVNCFSQSPNYLWGTQTGADGNSSGVANSIAVDSSGNVIVLGFFFSATITFGPETLTNVNPGSSDIFIVKYDPNGSVLWARQQDTGGTGNDMAYGVATDASGNVIVAGSFYSPTITFGTTTLTNGGSGDIFIVKFDPNGNVLWAKNQDAAGTGADNANSVAADANGNVIVTGYFDSDTITFGTTTLTNANAPNHNIFIVKYDSKGNVLWAKQQDAGGTGGEIVMDVAADANGNVLVSGWFDSPAITFGTTGLTNATADSTDIFIVKYDPNGNVLWAKQQDAGGTSGDAANSVAADASGNVFVTGYLNSPTITFGTTTLSNGGSSNIFVVKYDPNGNVLWAKQQDAGGTGGTDLANTVTADANGNSIVAGSFSSPDITFGTTTLTNADSSSSDIFIVKYDPNGNVVWVKQQDAGGAGDDGVNNVAVDASGNVFISGYGTVGSDPVINITFGPFTLGTRPIHMFTRFSKSFIAKLNGTITGIENYTLNHEVSAYPNPTTGLLFLSSNYDVTLSDLTGKIITKKQNTNAIDISNQPASMYFLLLTDKKGQLVHRCKVTKE